MQFAFCCNALFLVSLPFPLFALRRVLLHNNALRIDRALLSPSPSHLISLHVYACTAVPPPCIVLEGNFGQEVGGHLAGRGR